MAKKPRPSRPDPQEALAKIERPAMNWKVLGQIGLGLGVLWVVALMATAYVGYWGVGIMGALTAVAAGFGVYIWRLTRKSAAIVDILKGATDAEGRKAALEALRAQAGPGGKDAMNALAQSQLVAQENPQEAMRILEGVDVDKSPAVMQDEVRANLALLYLVHGRPRDARKLADVIRLDRQPQAKARALYAAVVAESFARTGKGDDALKLVETYSADDPELGEVRALLLRAQVFTYMAVKKRGLAAKSVEKLVALDPNMVAALVKGGSPELSQLARTALQGAGVIPKNQVRVRMR